MNVQDSAIEIISKGEYVKPNFITGNYPNKEVRSLVGEIVEFSESLIQENRRISFQEFEEQLTKKYNLLNKKAIEAPFMGSFFITVTYSE